MKFTMRAMIALALLATACGGGAPDVIEESLGVAHCRPDARCGRTGPEQYCADLSSDPQNCGACGNACAAGMVCQSGVCMPDCTGDAQDACGGRCTDFATDEANCGGCGIACAPVDQYCGNGDCMPACAAGLENCGVADAPVCVNTLSDADNCGTCGHQCPVQHACTEGVCTLICQADETRCVDAQGVPYCADTRTDAENCGGCGPAFACADGRACIASQCVAPCDATLTDCNGACVDTNTDPANCGACGNACAAGYSCTAGSCRLDCAPDQNHCGEGDAQYCTDTTTDPANCGSCNNACGKNQVCANATCLCTTDLVCGTECVDKNTDELNCGGCGVVCDPNGFEPICVEGVCEGDPNATSFLPAVTIADRLGIDYPSITFRGGASPGYWAAAGLGSTTNLASYDATSGASTGAWSTSWRYRSILTAGGSGEKVYFRYAASQYVYEMNMLTPGSVVVGVTLNGGPLGAVATDASVSVTADGSYWVTHNSGVVSLWNKVGGAWVKSITLQGWGSDPQVPNEASSAGRYRAAVARDKILTYSGGVLSIWAVDASGTTAQRRKVTLVGADTTFDFGLGYANDYVFVYHRGGKVWLGYRVGGL